MRLMLRVMCQHSQVMQQDGHERLQDDHPNVRHSALEALALMIPNMDKNAATRFMPTLRTFLRPFSHTLPTQRVIAALMCSVPLALGPMAPADRALVFDCFHQLAARPDLETRLHCIRSFPAVTIEWLREQTATAEGPLLDTFYHLATDSEVRRCCSSPGAGPRTALLTACPLCSTRTQATHRTAHSPTTLHEAVVPMWARLQFQPYRRQCGGRQQHSCTISAC